VEAHAGYMLVQVGFHEGHLDQRLKIQIWNQRSQSDSRRLFERSYVDLDPRVWGSASVMVSEPDSVCIFQAERAGRKKNSDIHHFGIRGILQRKEGEDKVLELCGDCLQVGSSQEDSREDCRGHWKHSRLQSDINKFSRRVDKRKENGSSISNRRRL